MEMPLLRRSKRWNKHPLRPLWKTHLFRHLEVLYPGAIMTTDKMTMFKQYKRVLNRFSNYTFSLNVTPNPDDPDVPFVQRISAVQTQSLLDNSEPA
jgi:hypothetical protein